MDWSRAKSVLIISFLLLNMLLGYQLWLDIRERLNANVDLSALPLEAAVKMQEKKIRLEASIPTDTPKLEDLTFRYTQKAAEGDKIELDMPISSRIVFNKSELLEGMGDIIPDLELYGFDAYMSDSSSAVFYRLHDGLPMFDVRMKLYYSNQQIIAYQQNRVEIIPGDDEREGQAVLPAATVVAHLIDKYLQTGSVVTDIQLGYHGQIFNSDIQVSAPSWRVLLEDGSGYYVNAISAEVTQMKDNVLLD
ncbi:hypothetical protein DNH61_07290 [Paenibacillus sambharensis]|uniref:Regulatory protein YycH-like domain-containing protein n=1 Tax=Paenibacillus sambharensis TaxID=1803190 RepID=A0A2W1LNT5_9BACL|nr:two-component system regulatory protein YycI [Paenibacillus sambharensis]PZD96592.1 hypothetical protein DNH61_07290 [Paenibacillus sambharensis]